MELTAIGLVTAKIEGTYGTDSTPTAAANTIAVFGNPTIKEVSTRIPRKLLDGSLGRLPGNNTIKSYELSFTVEARGNRTDGVANDISSGSITNVIEIDCLLQACNLAATYTPGSRVGNVVYKPTVPSTKGASATIYFYTQLKLFKLTGCKGTFKVRAEAGKMTYIDFVFKGIYNAPIDATFPTTQVFLDTKPPLLVSSTVTLDSYAAVLQKAEFDLGNDVQPVFDANATNGYNGFAIVSRDSKGSFDPESVAEATNPFWANWAADLVQTLTVPIGSQSGNTVTLTAVTQMVDINYGDRNGQRVHNATFEINRKLQSDALGSEFQLKFS